MLCLFSVLIAHLRLFSFHLWVFRVVNGHVGSIWDNRVSGGKNVAWSERLNCMMKYHSMVLRGDRHSFQTLACSLPADIGQCRQVMDDHLPDSVMIFAVAAGFVLFAQWRGAFLYYVM